MSSSADLPPAGQIRSKVGYVDDGRDWTAWLVWNMNQRRRLSERRFVLPPDRPVVTNVQTVKPARRKPRRRKQAQ